MSIRRTMTMTWRVLLTLSLVGQTLCATSQAVADDQLVERAAATVVDATVLVRMCCPPAQTVAKPANGPNAKLQISISVCSGVSLGNGLIVTSLRPVPSARFRITLPGGDRIDAQLRVVDDFSSLVMLEIENRKLPSITLTDKRTNVGSRSLSAAAWGVDMPVVSQGISAGIDRTLAGTTLPPLLQCDLRTTETSRGAGIVDTLGKLSGIVVVGTAQENRSGWAYAVPVTHVRRLVAAHKPGQLVVLKHRRPVVGLVLMQGDQPGVVQVQRVTEGGPAHAAGIRTGDVILQAEGYKIRSAYEAIKLVLRRQAGDEMEFAIRRGDTEKTIKVKLGDAITSGDKSRFAGGRSAPADVNSNLVDPSVNVRRVGKEIEVKRGNQTRVVNGKIAAAGKVQLLEKASSQYLQLIAQQMKIIERMRTDLQSRDGRIESLERELRELKKRLPPTPRRKVPAEAG